MSGEEPFDRSDMAINARRAQETVADLKKTGANAIVAKYYYDLFLEFKTAGFTPDEAIKLLIAYCSKV